MISTSRVHFVACQSATSTTPGISFTSTTLHPSNVTPVPITEALTPTPTAAPPTHAPVPDAPMTLPPTPSPTHAAVPTTEAVRPLIGTQISAIQSFLEDQAFAGEFSGAVLIAQQGVPVLQDAYGLADCGLEVPNQFDM